MSPDALLVEAASEAAAAAIIERARGANESGLAAVLLLPERASRLRLPSVTEGVVTLARRKLDGDLTAALDSLLPTSWGAPVLAGCASASTLRLACFAPTATRCH